MGKIIFIFVGLINFVSMAHAVYVDTMIVVAVDVSGSINDDEYQVQKNGIVEAFSDPAVQSLVMQCSNNGIGITYLEWSGRVDGGMQTVLNPVNQVIPWTLLRRPQDMTAFANQLLASKRSSRGSTDIAYSLDFSLQLFGRSPFESSNRIISVSTDGVQSQSALDLSADDYLRYERDRVAALGIRINGLAIERPFEPDPRSGSAGSSLTPADETIEVYLNQNVRSGPGSFVESVEDFVSYGNTFKRQLTVMLNACIS